MSSEEAPLVEEEIREAPVRRFNPRVFKVVCLTLLTCLLLACLAFTLCTVYKQRLEIQDLQRSSEKMDRYLAQWKRDSVMERRVPMKKMPAIDLGVRDFFETTQSPLEPLSYEEKENVEILWQDLGQFIDASQMNLWDLRNQMKRSNWKSLESWLRNWLIFQKARQQEVTTTTALIQTPVSDSKCLQEARNTSTLIGSFRPRCDHSGGYRPVQCWPATRLCWCVDPNGVAINETTTIGRPRCPRTFGRV